MLACSHKFRI
ncbi:hypothetical protein EC900039_3851A, partial [Escherichia coli 90.0039]